MLTAADDVGTVWIEVNGVQVVLEPVFRGDIDPEEALARLSSTKVVLRKFVELAVAQRKGAKIGNLPVGSLGALASLQVGAFFVAQVRVDED